MDSRFIEKICRQSYLLRSVFCALFLLGLSLASAWAVEPIFSLRAWQMEDGLPEDSVTALVQTHDGYLWVGTFNGMARFDGLHFTIFNGANTPELQNNRVTSLYEDAAHRLWIGQETGDLTVLEAGQFRSVPVKSEWRRGPIIDTRPDADGDLWLLFASGAVVRLKDGLTYEPKPNAAFSGPWFLSRGKKELWLVRDGELARFDHGKLIPEMFTDQESGNIRIACVSRDGGLWVHMNGRLKKWMNGICVTNLGREPWRPSYATTLLEMRSGTLAVGTQESGLFLIFQDGTCRNYSPSNGLSHVWVRSLCEDQEGNLWVGTHGGLDVLRPSRLFDEEPPDHWSGQAVLSVCTTPDGAVLAGTEGAGLYRLKDESWTHYGMSEGISNLFVWSLARDAQDRLWVGTWGGPLLVQLGSSFVPAPGLESVKLTTAALYAGRRGELWAGTSEGLLRFDKGRLTRFGTKEGLVLPDVRAIAEDKDGTIWFGMLGGGLGRLQNGSLKQFRKADGLASDFVQVIQPEADGDLWLGTVNGLSRFRAGRFAHVGLAQGLPNEVICAIQDDGQGHFWIGSHNGIFRLDKKELNRCANGEESSVGCMYFGKNDGIPSLECSGGLQPASGMTPDGRVWIPTRKGLAVVAPREAKQNMLPLPVNIESVFVAGHQIPMSTLGGKVPLVIPPGQRRLEVRFTAVCFRAPEQVRFSYRLEGFESDWVPVEAGSPRTANYGYLPPGQYTFRVTACNNDGLWNPVGADLPMVVLPHLWEIWWIQGISGLALTSSVVAAGMLVARRRMHRKLERLERQQVLERERMRIAKDIHDDLGSSLIFISMLSQSARDQMDRPGALSEHLNQIFNTARNTIRAMDEIVWAVNPKHDTLDSLATYLTKFAQDFLAPAAIRCRSRVPMEFNDRPLTSEVRHNLFLALKEALQNVVKHAQASEVRLSLELEDAAFQVCVADNGKGFVSDTPVPAPVPGGERILGGNGLHNMRQRLEQIGGRCEIHSAPGQGTKVIFRIEMKRPGTAGLITKTDD